MMSYTETMAMSFLYASVHHNDTVCIFSMQVFGFIATIVFAFDFYIIFNDLADFLRQGGHPSEERPRQTAHPRGERPAFFGFH